MRTKIKLTTIAVVSVIALLAQMAGWGPVYAQGPEESEYQPMPLPEWQPPLRYGDEQNVAWFDPETGVESVIAMPLVEDALPANSSPGLAYNESRESEPDISATSFSNLSLVSNPHLYPWRVNVKVFMEFRDSGGHAHFFVCSGTLIDPMHVITAGHCVFDHEDGYGWAHAIRVVPGYENGDAPYGDARTVLPYSFTGWVVNKNWDWDLGLLLLDRPIGALVNWHGFGHDPSNRFFENSTFHSAGYPGESPYNGQYMYYWFGRFDKVGTHVVYHDKRGYKGQSGSGMYYKNDQGQRFVYGVRSHMRNDVEAGYTRIESNKFSSIRDQINTNTPSTVDLVALDVNASPSTITAGSRLSSMNFLVYNNSLQRRPGTVSLKVYLSSNNAITEQDTLLSSTSFTANIAAKGSTRVTVTSPPTIPITAEGTYWIGVVLTSSDANNSNNDSSGQDAQQIYVRAFVPGAPTRLQASDGTYHDRVYLTWDAVSGATSYAVYRAASAIGSKQYLGSTTRTYYSDDDVSVDRFYYYFVTAKAENNRTSVYSSSNVGYAESYKAYLPLVLRPE